MPIIRKVMDLGTCKAVTIPKSWLEFFEKELGQEIEFVCMEVDREIKILPYLQRKKASKK